MSTDGFWELSAKLLLGLKENYTSKEVLSALNGMGPLKAPGPNGFQPLFFQCFWNLVGDSVCEVVLKVLMGGELPVGLNETLLH